MGAALGVPEIQAALARFPRWSYDGHALVRTFDRVDFAGAVAFVNAVAVVANRLDHHPDIALSWNEVTIRTWSHDVDGITARDFRLVAAIEESAG